MEWWFTADQHFDHKNVMEYCNRPWDNVEEMNQALIDNWNNVVHGGDTVVVIGDICLESDPELVRYRFLRHLKGNKIYVKGNHDHWLRGAEKRYMYIHKCNGQMIHCCHYPLRTWAASNRKATWQLHGHTHGMQEPYANQYDVGVDSNSYSPVSLTELRAIIPVSNSLGEGRSLLDKQKKVKIENKCEFYPAPEEETCICGAGSDISGGDLICTKEYSESCQWAQEVRDRDEKAKVRIPTKGNFTYRRKD